MRQNGALLFFAMVSLVSLAFTSTAFGLSTPEGACAVFGGHPDPQNGNKVQVEFLCNATLTTSREVTMAAHCTDPLKRDPKMKVKVACGYTQSRNPRDFSSMFREISTPASIETNPKFSSQGDDTGQNDYAVIHLSTPSTLQPITLVSQAQASQEFWTPLRNSSGKSTVQCSQVGCATDPTGTLNGSQITDVTSNLEEVSDAGSVTASFNVKLGNPDDINTWAALDKKTRADSTEDSYGRQAAFLFSRQLLNSNFPKGEPGTLICRDNPNSPWKTVAPANSIDFETVGQSPDGELAIALTVNWDIPDLSKVTQTLLPAPAAATKAAAHTVSR